MRLARILWSTGSLLVNVTIAIYISLISKAPSGLQERYTYINEKWSVFSAHWKVEFLLMTMVAISAVYFAIQLKKISWSIISIGQIILLMTYPFMLGGYRNTPFELAEMANQMATIVFVFGNLIFLSGLFLLYLNDKSLRAWLRYTAIVLSGITILVFSITFAEIINWKQAMVIGPLINVLYLINAYYGLKMKPEV